MSLERLPEESLMDYKYRILLEKSRGDIDISWKEINDLLNLGLNPDTIRKGTFFLPEYSDYIKSKLEDRESVQEVYKYKEATEILGDGSQKSDKLISMSLEQSKDVNYLLKAHGFDVNEWELVSARNNIWNTNSKSQGVQTLFSSKITVKPKVTGFNIEKFIESVKKEIKPITIVSPTTSEKKLLEIPLFDMHFGIADLNYYEDTYKEILHKIHSRKWDTILFVIGQDLLHNDGFEGKTTSGTVIEQVNMEKAWDDAFQFYSNLITEALMNSKHVKGIYSAGNHDRGISFGFVKSLEQKFPQAEFDSGIKHRKHFVWNDVALFFTHGDKGHNRMTRNFLDEYGKIIANAKIVEIHSGHLHAEKSKDDFGVVVRTLSTRAKTDQWHYDQGFIGAEKRFQLFEYSQDSLDAIYYV